MPDITLQNTVDAWVSADRASKFGDTRLYVHSLANAYVYFSRPNLPEGAIITSATLKMYPGQSTGVGSITLNVHRLTSAFDPNAITWNAQPSVGALSGSSTRTWYNSATPFSISVTADVTSIINGGDWFGWRISSTGVDSTQYLFSGQSPTPMELEIAYTAPPPAPIDLYPSNNRIVNDPKPTLQWMALGGASSEQLAIQVQVATNVGFTTGLYTSNEISTNSSSYDLDVAAPTFTALTAGAVRYWRVRVKNSMGVWSAYSDPAQFTYQVAFIANITAPSGNTSDPTPNVTWTYTGVQAAYQIVVSAPYSPSSPQPGGILYDSGIQYGTGTTFTLPVGIVRYSGATYTTTLRIWDSSAVVSVAGAPAYNEDIQTFTWVPTGATTPVQLLVTAEIAPYPPRLIRWEYTGSAAASFLITRKRNGVADKMWSVLFGDSREGATNWFRTIDRVVPGRAEVVYSVKTVMASGLTSSSDPELTVKMDHKTFWCQSVYDATKVFCLVNHDVDPGLTELADVVRPVGGVPFLAVQSLGAYNGDVAGLISNDAMPAYSDLTSEKMKANYLWLRKNPRVYITWADESVECFIYGTTLVPIPTANGKTDYSVSFNFVQIQDDIFKV